MDPKEATPVELGLIEGFYGRPWSWEARAEAVAFLGPRGYSFYLYAPKADAFLRRRWREPHPPEATRRLAELAVACRRAGVRFGVGLSPLELWKAFDASARDALAAKLAGLDDLGIRDLAVLFDDMRGDLDDLAERQARIAEWIAARTAADRVLVCPTYYSDDPVLDRAFGRRPDDYLSRLGAALDPALDVFWTGEEVVSREISPGHLGGVAERLNRPPVLWDNYPVNDGSRMSRHLHLRAFTGRPASLAGAARAHAINVALQPVLSRIPALTLPDSYRLGEEYRYGEAFLQASIEVLGETLGTRVWEDVLALQDVGLERLGERAGELRSRYEGVDHPGAREIVAWLDGRWRVTDEVLSEA